jgi:hypothetical protein
MITAAVALTVLVGLGWAADEIAVTALLKVANGEFSLERRAQNVKFDQTNQSSSYNIQNIGTASAEQITIIADVATNGWAYFKNLSTVATQTVDIGVQDTGSTFIAFIQLKGTEIAMLRLHPTNNIYAQATGGIAVNLEAWVNED